MSNYVKATNFATKDTLAPGNPLKRVQGTELDDEFNSIATAIGTKADKASPSFTGTPTAPTATLGTSSTQLATTAFVQAALQVLYPVGTIYTNVVSTNPATLFGFGTWVAFGTGRTLVGIDSGDTVFDTVEETGGSKDAIVVAHTHTGTTASGGTHTHTYQQHIINTVEGGGGELGVTGGYSTLNTSSAGAHTHTFTTASTGDAATNKNLQPYIVVYFWKRTA